VRKGGGFNYCVQRHPHWSFHAVLPLARKFLCKKNKIYQETARNFVFSKEIRILRYYNSRRANVIKHQFSVVFVVEKWSFDQRIAGSGYEIMCINGFLWITYVFLSYCASMDYICFFQLTMG
jgi:hypothetical protein